MGSFPSASAYFYVIMGSLKLLLVAQLAVSLPGDLKKLEFSPLKKQSLSKNLTG